MQDANDESMLAVLLARTGKSDAALRQIARVKLEASNVASLSDLHHAQYAIGVAYALLGEVRSAMPWLIKATREGMPCYPLFERDPNLANVRQDPEFIALLAQLRTQWERFRQTL
jgi:ATP/maltotriose-dependent transcriptional regulator MalT